MRFIVICVSFVVTFVFMASASANCNEVGCSNERILSLRPEGNGRVLVAMSGDLSMLNCTPIPGGFAELSQSSPGFYTMYSMLLSAQNLDRTLKRVRMENGLGTCRILYVEQSG